MARPRSDRTVYRITAVGRSLSDDLDDRTRRYLWSMGVRTACFIGAYLASGWLRWTLVVGAVLLPYIAVVVANAGREPRGDALPMAVLDTRAKALPGASGAPGEDTDAGGGPTSAPPAGPRATKG